MAVLMTIVILITYLLGDVMRSNDIVSRNHEMFWKQAVLFWKQGNQ